MGLYDPRAGFPRHSTIKVWAPPEWELNVEDAVKGWNHVACRRLFTAVKDQEDAQVTLHDTNDGEYTIMIGADGQFTRTEPYIRCEVHTTYTKDLKYHIIVAEHEMGHCLGFQHRPRGIMGSGDFSIHADRRMLKRAGYV